MHPSESDVHIDAWVMQTIAGPLRQIFRPCFYVLQDPASQEYFIRTKYAGNKSELDADLSALRDPAQVKQLAANGRQALKPLEERLESSGGPFIFGDRPSHADSAIYGWYVSTRVNGIGARLVFESDENPNVKRWVEAMKKVTGLEPVFDVEF